MAIIHRGAGCQPQYVRNRHCLVSAPLVESVARGPPGSLFRPTAPVRWERAVESDLDSSTAKCTCRFSSACGPLPKLSPRFPLALSSGYAMTKVRTRAPGLSPLA